MRDPDFIRATGLLEERGGFGRPFRFRPVLAVGRELNAMSCRLNGAGLSIAWAPCRRPRERPAEDRFAVPSVQFAAATSAGAAANLQDAASNAMGAAFALNGNAGRVAAQFAFNGRTYLAIDQDLVGNGIFADGLDLLIDNTGVTGTISLANFTT
jgi:hypothetical protein